MNKTKIDWATMSWNPVTGCRHGCPYCYARRTARRFDAGCADPAPAACGLHVLTEKIKATPYPYGFEPTMHRYRLNQPERPGRAADGFCVQHGGSVWPMGANLLDRGGPGRLPTRTAAPLFVSDQGPGPDTWSWTTWPCFHTRAISGMAAPWQTRTQKPCTPCRGWQQQLLVHGAAAGAGRHEQGGGTAAMGDPGSGNREPPGKGGAAAGVGGSDHAVLCGE